jgi:hypothetical protein
MDVFQIGEMMNNDKTCNCTIECIGMHLCEIGTWVQPDKAMALSCAENALMLLGDWLFQEPRSTTEVVAEIFKHTSFVDDPCKIDLFIGFWEAMCTLGLEPSSQDILKAVWTPWQHSIDNCRKNEGDSHEPKVMPVVSQPGVSVSSKPRNFQRVLEFMVALSAEMLINRDLKTSKIADLMFPRASEEALDGWLIHAIDDCLCRIGFTPESSTEEDKTGIFDDPYWWCDGDPKEMLHFNLWCGDDTRS